MLYQNISKIYQAFGYREEVKNEEIAIFLYEKGRYFGVDIIPLNDDIHTLEQAEKIKSDYSQSGYAVTLKKFNTEFEIEEELYKSFFSFDNTIVRLQRKYKDFETKQTSNLFNNRYEYIPCPYEVYDCPNIDNQSFIDLISEIIFRKESSDLIIIEAAAGYGKTSAAYEILSSLTSDKLKLKTPILTELSRNRGASIFKYILLDEIDIEYPILNSELVIKEIKSGRIPLIIDGFDELLDKINLESDISTLEEVEPMLNTIVNLLEKNAKVILTTRKTAIFSGHEFENWYSQWAEKFNVTRISIKEPSVKDWLGEIYYQKLEERNLPINYVANPVILSYLRNLSIEEFTIQIENPENLVDTYFEKMLEREKERQDILLRWQEQYSIFKNVVILLLELDCVVENKEFFKEIIKEQNQKTLEAARNLYVEKPTIDNLVDRLATHALLDRKGRMGNKIGFINDFVLGTFIGEILREKDVEEIKKYSSYMIELAVTAYKVQSNNKKLELWQKLMSIEENFSQYTIFNFDCILKNSLNRDYQDLMIKEMLLSELNFLNYSIKSSVFINCKFRNCHFDTKKLEGITFIDCVFEKCYTEDNTLVDNDNTVIINCQQIDCQIFPSIIYDKDQPKSLNEFDMIVLKFLYDNANNMKKYQITSLFTALQDKKRKQISDTLLKLEYQNYINVYGNHLNFNINKISEIKNILNLQNGQH